MDFLIAPAMPEHEECYYKYCEELFYELEAQEGCEDEGELREREGVKGRDVRAHVRVRVHERDDREGEGVEPPDRVGEALPPRSIT